MVKLVNTSDLKSDPSMGCRFKSDSEYFIDFEEHMRDESLEESPVPSFILGNNQGERSQGKCKAI